jgi:hypothetical protein
MQVFDNRVGCECPHAPVFRGPYQLVVTEFVLVALEEDFAGLVDETEPVDVTPADE